MVDAGITIAEVTFCNINICPTRPSRTDASPAGHTPHPTPHTPGQQRITKAGLASDDERLTAERGDAVV